MKPEHEIKQKKYDREAETQQKAEPELIHSGWLSVSSAHRVRISIFA
jgi:hypothetical protein